MAIAGSRSPELPVVHEQKIRVDIEIIADSLNTMTASVVVELGTNARNLMEKLFQISYADRGKKFIDGIAGFQASRAQRQFWSLEIDGVFSKVGIAEITLQKKTRIVWRLTTY